MKHIRGNKCYSISQVDEETQANAQLIAAAPDLLDALKGMLIAHRLELWKTTNNTDNAVVNKLKKAIAKAEGK